LYIRSQTDPSDTTKP